MKKNIKIKIFMILVVVTLYIIPNQVIYSQNNNQDAYYLDSKGNKIRIITPVNPREPSKYETKTVSYEKGNGITLKTENGGKSWRQINKIQETISHKENCISMFPNPTSDYILIELSKYYDKSIYLEILNLYGYKMDSDIKIENKQVKIDVSSYSTGTYFVVCHSDSCVEIFKFIKE